MEKQIKLIKPNIEWEQAIINYRNEFSNQIDGIAGSSQLVSFERIEDWLTYLKLSESWETIPNKDFVPGIQYLLVNEMTQKVLGMAHLRLELNDYLINVGGHIGYSVSPSERRNGYGKLVLRETLVKAKELSIDKILVTCDDDNIGSAKVIEGNNGILENKFFEESIQNEVRRYWIDNH